MRPPAVGVGDPGLEVESLLEVDVDQVIAAHHAVQGEGAAVQIDALQARHFAGRRLNRAGDTLEVLDLRGQLFEQVGVSGVGMERL